MFDTSKFKTEEQEECSYEPIEDASKEVRAKIAELRSRGVKDVDIVFLADVDKFEVKSQQGLFVFLSMAGVFKTVTIKILKVGLRISTSVLEILIEEFED
jgi:hypothetical protein